MIANPLRTALLALAALGLVISSAPAPAFAAPASLSLASPASHYMARRDYRRCVSPLCGGYWIRSVNGRKTRCADGTWDRECYVGGLDLAPLGLNEADAQAFEQAFAGGYAVALGVQRRGTFDGFPDVASLTVRKAWEAANGKTPGGFFARLDDTGMACFTTPCFHISERILNQRRRYMLSGLDLSKVGAGDEELAAADAALADGDLVVAGRHRRVLDAGPAGHGLELAATQFYLPVEPSAVISSCASCGPTQVCVDDPSDACGGCGCPTVCVDSAAPFCGGIAGIQCPSGLTCMDDPDDSCDPDCGGADCGGVCVSADSPPPMCGGFAGFQCGLGLTCIEASGDGCSPMCGGADCAGACVSVVGGACGGFAGIACGPGLECVDPLEDGCDNACGGADCGGVCVVAGAGSSSF